MPQTIQYEGDSTVAVDAVLRFFAQDNIGPWYVELYLQDDEGDDPPIKGHVIDFNREVEPGLAYVTIQPWNADTFEDTGDPISINTEDIVTVIVP